MRSPRTPTAGWALVRGCLRASHGAWALAALAVVCIACESARPDLEEWIRVWGERPVVPTQAEFEAQEGRALCERLLADVRKARARLLPTADPELDRTVQEWLRRTAGLGFDCPSSGQLREASEEIRVLEAEVAAGLATLQDAKPSPSS